MKCKKCFKGYQDCEHYLDGYCQAPLKKLEKKGKEDEKSNKDL